MIGKLFKLLLIMGEAFGWICQTNKPICFNFLMNFRLTILVTFFQSETNEIIRLNIRSKKCIDG